MLSLDKFKNNKKQKNKSLHKPLLVLLSDGFGLLASVVDKQAGEVTIVASARSPRAEPAAALADVFGRLSVSYGKLPKETILIHTQVIPALLDLPIDNIENFATDKIHELIRWEMESVFTDIMPHDNLGWIMIGLGYITEIQRDDLINRLASQNETNSKKLRLGDIAVSEGYINRNQLEVCLKLQDQLQLQDQRIKCAWSKIVSREKIDWLATAVAHSVHTQWVDSLHEVSTKGTVGKTKLKSIYPYIGASSSQLKSIYSGEKTYILELHRPYLAVNSYEGGRLIESLILSCNTDTPEIRDVESLINNADIPEGYDIYVIITHPDRTVLREQLESLSHFYFKHMEREAKIPTNLTGDVSSAEASMILGATFNHLNSEYNAMVPVEGAPPAAPILQRPETKIAACILLFLTLVATIESFYVWRMNKADKNLVAVEKQLSLQKKVKKDISKSKKAKANLEQLKVEHKDLVDLKKLMETVLVTRNNFMNDFLDIIVVNINDNIVIDSINEQNWNNFVIQGWSLDQASVEYFSQGLSRDLKEWGMTITENPSELARNASNNFSGYKFRMVINKAPVVLPNSVPAVTVSGGR